jgi:ferrous iron transport protein B
VLAIVCAKLLKTTVLRGETPPFVMELPPYRMPTLKSVGLHMWNRGGAYLKKAATIILGISILLWAGGKFPSKPEFDQDYDAMAEKVTTEYKQGVSALNASAGLPADSTLLLESIEAEMAAEEARESYYETQPEYAAAMVTKADTLRAIKARPGGETIATLLKLRDDVAGIHDDFDKTVEKKELDEKETPEKYAAAMKDRDDDLAALAKAHPELYRVVVRYREEVEAPYQDALTDIDNQKANEELAYSAIGRIGGALEPVLRPAGFDWKIATAMIGAFAAKEVFVAQMGIVYSLGEQDPEKPSKSLTEKLQANYTPLQGFSIMLFCLISAPCMATIAVTKRESNSWRWALFQLGGLTVLAWIVSVAVYQIGSLVT